MKSHLLFLLPAVATLAFSACNITESAAQAQGSGDRNSLRFVQVELTKFGARQQLDVSGAGYNPFTPPPPPEYFLQVAFQVDSPALAGQNVSVEVVLLGADGTLLQERETGGGSGTVPAKRTATLAFGPQGLTGKAGAQFPYSRLTLQDGQHVLRVAITARAGGVEAVHNEKLQLRIPVRGPIDDMVLVDANGNSGRLGDLPVSTEGSNGQLNESLLSAAARGDAEAVQNLLFQDANVLHRGAGGRTALHLAAEGGHLEAVRILASAPPPDSPRQDLGGISDDNGGLFSNNYDPNKPPSEEDNAAFEARLKAMSFDAYVDDVQKVLSMQDDDGLSPLHLAVAGGHFEVTDLLISLGAQLDTPDLAGMTALHAAAVAEDDALCALLLAKGASPYSRNGAGQTPLDLAGSDALKRRLKGTLDKLANDPEHTAARQVVLAFLGAVRLGDAARARQLVTPEQAERLPAKMSPSSFEMEVLSTEQHGLEAQVVVWTQMADIPSQCKEFKTTYLLQRVGESWLIAESETVPFVATLDRKEDR